MRRPFHHDHPGTLDLDAEVLDLRPGAVLLDRSPFFPGGGGQAADRGRMTWAGGEAEITGTMPDPRGVWHQVAFGDGAAPHGTVRLAVDPGFRAMMSESHTLAHVLNALVHARFDGALLTGAQIGVDGTFRLDCDLPGADNDALRALEGPMNDAIRQNRPVRTSAMAYEEARAIPGLFRSKAVAPPPGADGTVRIVEIAGLDRQACGGTHLGSTGMARPARIIKVENKGRHNRRIRVAVG